MTASLLPPDRTPPRSAEACPNCTRLERERDAALGELAREREVSNALRLAAFGPGRGLPPLPEYPETVGPGAPPLRYLLVDQLNERFKGVFGLAHRTGRELLARARGRRG